MTGSWGVTKRASTARSGWEASPDGGSCESFSTCLENAVASSGNEGLSGGPVQFVEAKSPMLRGETSKCDRRVLAD